jgi:hypothetical protein
MRNRRPLRYLFCPALLGVAPQFLAVNPCEEAHSQPSTTLPGFLLSSW